MPTVPWGITALAYSPTPIMEDSTWMWPSKNPGAMYCPSASITRVSGPMQWEPSPTRAILPWAMATSVCSIISPVHTFTSLASRITVSAGILPSAVAASVIVASHSGVLQNLLIISSPF